MQAVIEIGKLKRNIVNIRAKTRNRFCAVVKAQAYGHGINVAAHIERLVDCYFVANLGEAAALTLCGISKPILVLGGDLREFTRFYDGRIVPTVCSVSQLIAVRAAGYKSFSVAANTGMNRLGADCKGMDAIASYCKQHDILPFSVYSHIYGGADSAIAQSEEFEYMTRDPIFKRNRHLYSSCALDMDSDAQLFDMCRIGIAMYGYASGMQSCIKLRAPIIAINNVERGMHVGYGTYVLPHDTRVATVRCGYADGLRRSNLPQFMRVRGADCRILGQPCMDVCMIDLGNTPCRMGEYAYLIADKADAMRLAECYDTIIYEVLTGFNARAQRIYV